MSYIGITPSEDSSGQKRRQGSITRTGNEACRRAAIEAAWQYRLPARVTPHIRKRQHGQPREVLALAWKAQTRLCERYQTLVRNRKKTVVVVTAVARELVGFLWAVAMQVEGRAPAARMEKTALQEGKQAPPAKPVRHYRLDGAKKHAPGKRPAEKNKPVNEAGKKTAFKK